MGIRPCKVIVQTMINQKTVSELRKWFKDYVNTFRSNNPEDQRNFDLKEEHTRQVCIWILDIGKNLGLSEEDLCIAEVMALFHDIGRFEQYDRYGTYSDLRSEDHALLGVNVLRENGVLDKFEQSIRELILQAISYHNRFDLPKSETEMCLLFTKLLRDADKVDIWRVVTEYYCQKDGIRNGTIELGLPDTPEISDEVYIDLMEGRIVRMGSLKTLTDFKLLQMAWIYDINFPRTFELIREKGYLEIILNALPQSEKVSKIYSAVKLYLEEHCHYT